MTKISRAPWPYTEQDAREFLMRPRSAADATFLIVTLEGGGPRIIGGIGIRPEGEAHELGYWLTPDAWGRGYATEAGHQMLQIARYALKLKRLTAGHYIDNPASARVLAKLGFVPAGRTEPQFCRARGREVTCVRLERDLDEGQTDDVMPIAA